MFEQPADVVQCHIAQPSIATASKQRLVALPQALVGVHARAVVLKQRLGHERSCLAVQTRHILDDVFVQHHPVAAHQQRTKADVDFALAARAHLVVVQLYFDAAVDHRLHHLHAEVVVGIGGRHGEVAALVGGLVAEVGAFVGAAVPTAFQRVYRIERLMGLLVEPDVVEDEKLRFRPENGHVGDLGAPQVVLRPLGDAARVACIILAGDGVLNGADQRQGRHLGERIHQRGVRIGQDEHVGFVDGLPAANGGAVEAEAVLEYIGFQHGNRYGKVLPDAGQIDELEIDHLRLLVTC